ncbi:MerR family transcriptional regulator [Erysipelothrix inopinata]|uniref:MerR family transcriptional regulator n=1 Tax=Erysipelothrix inopinata TaxID=225084 RepID=A0A7G9S043_9FIRM|nr:MerR family transcriptional regulator [Erysipelothrix inopinata]QNN61218.1 MerR family transcriptional regulator [Erysipelothrix inopinata]
MKISLVEEITGISASTIRYYEQINLVIPIRDENNYRNYSDSNVETLLEIKLLKKLGFPLKVIEKIINKEMSLQQGIDTAIHNLEQQKSDIDDSLQLLNLLKESHHDKKKIDTRIYVGKLFDFKVSNHPFIDFCDSISDLLAKYTFTLRKGFYPEEIISTPRDFTLELLRYAQREEKTLEILNESMHPVIIVNGRQYQAIRTFEKYGIPIVYFKPKSSSDDNTIHQ